MKLSNDLYDKVKWIEQYLLPGLATLYFALSSIWGLPNADKVVGTIVAFDAFLGLILGLSTIRYKPTREELTSELAIKMPTKSPTIPRQSIKGRHRGVFIKMSNDTYDALIMVCRYILPALGTFVFAISGIWGFNYGQQVIGTIAAITTFMGVLLGISTSQYRSEIKNIKTRNMETPESG